MFFGQLYKAYIMQTHYARTDNAYHIVVAVDERSSSSAFKFKSVPRSLDVVFSFHRRYNSNIIVFADDSNNNTICMSTNEGTRSLHRAYLHGDPESRLSEDNGSH